MKKYLIVLLLGAILVNCSKKGNNGDTDSPQNNTGKPMPVGQPVAGTKVQKPITAAQGGSITSQDGAINVTIPAGALKTDQTVSIEAITNTMPRIKHAYRLEPSGDFNKPVTLTFNYTDESIAGTSTSAVRVATQRPDGVWE